MKKQYTYIIILSIVAIIGLIAIICIYNKPTEENNSNYNASRTSQNIVAEENIADDSVLNNSIEQNETEETEKEPIKESIENEISSFTTKIYNKDSDRQNNVTLACSALNGSIIDTGTTFSFCNIVGKATSAKGYKKADVFKNGEVVEALGGGLCQVSTTLYNAVLEIPDVNITERHSHSNKVPYISSGKDAAVSYGTYDLQFVNNTGKSLKIEASNTPDDVTIKIWSFI